MELHFHQNSPRQAEKRKKTIEYEYSSLGPCELKFDSTFESGNLDLAIQVQQKEFNLYLRPDTNTKGYCNWFFFKVQRRPTAKGRYPQQKYQFNILNLYKKKTLFANDARPLACFQEILNQGFMQLCSETSKWRPSQFSNINYSLTNFCGESIPEQKPPMQPVNPYSDWRLKKVYDNSNSKLNKTQKFYCLSFDFEFMAGQDFAYIASSIPYSYSFLQRKIRHCQRLH